MRKLLYQSPTDPNGDHDRSPLRAQTRHACACADIEHRRARNAIVAVPRYHHAASLQKFPPYG